MLDVRVSHYMSIEKGISLRLYYTKSINLIRLA